MSDEKLPEGDHVKFPLISYNPETGEVTNLSTGERYVPQDPGVLVDQPLPRPVPIREHFMTRGELADIVRDEATAIQNTQRMMQVERQAVGWNPSQLDRARLDAVDAANHQLVFSLLSIADRLEGK